MTFWKDLLQIGMVERWRDKSFVKLAKETLLQVFDDANAKVPSLPLSNQSMIGIEKFATGWVPLL